MLSLELLEKRDCPAVVTLYLHQFTDLVETVYTAKVDTASPTVVSDVMTGVVKWTPVAVPGMVEFPDTFGKSPTPDQLGSVVHVDDCYFMSLPGQVDAVEPQGVVSLQMDTEKLFVWNAKENLPVADPVVQAVAVAVVEPKVMDPVKSDSAKVLNTSDMVFAQDVVGASRWEYPSSKEDVVAKSVEEGRLDYQSSVDKMAEDLVQAKADFVMGVKPMVTVVDPVVVQAKVVSDDLGLTL